MTKILRKSWLLLFFIFINTVFIACSSGPTQVESDLGLEGVPDWVNKGTSALKTDEGRLFHGVGSAPVMDDLSFQTGVADNRARAEIARILTSYMEVVSRDYMASGKAAEQGYTQATASREISNVSKVNLTGARIIGHWRDKRSGIIYAIAELDMEQAKDIIKQVKMMDEGLINHLSSQAENIFDHIADREE